MTYELDKANLNDGGKSEWRGGASIRAHARIRAQTYRLGIATLGSCTSLPSAAARFQGSVTCTAQRCRNSAQPAGRAVPSLRIPTLRKWARIFFYCFKDLEEDRASGWDNATLPSPGVKGGSFSKWGGSDGSVETGSLITTGYLAADAFMPTDFFNQRHAVQLDLTDFAMLHINERKVLWPQTRPVPPGRIGGEHNLNGSGAVPIVLQQVCYVFHADIHVV
ncbi:hypothetical protein BDK51DRAFT_28673 [Blyttiomyces helicus]|uniref:Uncharacterized protein n=1 Tax=Blyttiomyces helicus TaxID=388810 RepID=A0A4P9W7S8_9FUNG|nr:hypothetical protein BDK51DRAFT_28673 [Blyttiomyces helicus]|eukprot:RKO87445.1 hypothetical protein BDK51DRAFT_28673 [Blyttiomyces helicus]